MHAFFQTDYPWFSCALNNNKTLFQHYCCTGLRPAIKNGDTLPDEIADAISEFWAVFKEHALGALTNIFELLPQNNTPGLYFRGMKFTTDHAVENYLTYILTHGLCEPASCTTSLHVSPGFADATRPASSVQVSVVLQQIEY